MTDPRLPDHPGDRLSAFVDDELAVAERAAVADHLEDCETCRDEVAAALAVKQRVLDLPPVAGDGAIGRFVARHRAALRAATAFVLASSTLVLALGVTASVVRPTVLPAVDPLLAAHEATPETMGMAPTDEVDDAYVAPPALIGNRANLSRRAAYAADGVAVVVYGADDRADVPGRVTVSQQHGRVAWDELPAGERLDVGGRRVWSRPGTPTVLVTELGDLVVTVVADDRASALTAVTGLPEVRRRSAFDRLHDSCQRLTRVFALDG